MRESRSAVAGQEAGKSKWLILGLLFLGWFLGNIDRLSMSYAIVAITKDFSLSASAAGLVLSAFFLGYAAMQVPGGWLTDRVGSKRVLLVVVFVWSVFTGATGAAWSLASLVAVRVLFGIGEGSFQPAAQKMITEVFPSPERGRAVSIMLSSSVLAAIIVSPLMGLSITKIGWRWSFYAIGILGAVVVILYLLLLKPRPYDAEAGVAAAQPEKGALRKVLSSPFLWYIVLCAFCTYTLNWGLVTWMPTYLSKARGLDLTSIGYLLAIPGLAALASTLLSGFVLDRIKGRLANALTILSMACVAALVFGMYSCATVAAFIAYQSIVYVFISYLIIYIPSVLLKRFPSTQAGSAVGVMNFGAQLAGLVTPLVMGSLVDASGGSFEGAFVYLIVLACVGIVAFGLLALSERRKAVAAGEARA
jgi:Sugar phosphate permease